MLVEQNQEVLRRHAKSFYLASLFLPSQVAVDASSLYRFAREVDDICDELSPEQARIELGRVTQDFVSGSAQIDFVRDFAHSSQRLGMDPRLAQELLTGVGWDLDHDLIANEEDFYLYCYRVAGVVGLMMCFILRIEDPRAHAHATDLGLAMQMTNICRDVVEDLERGRMYLPLEWMDGIVLNPQNISLVSVRKKTREIVQRILRLAEQHYASADYGMAYIPWRARFAILLAAKLYRAIGLKILRNPQSFLEGRVYLRWWEKLFWIVYCAAYFFHPRIWRKAQEPAQIVLHPSLWGRPGLG